MDQDVETKESITDLVREKLKLRVLTPVAIIGAGVGFLAFGGYVAISSFVAKIPEPILLKDGGYVPGEVLVKVKPGINPGDVIQRALRQPQTVYRNNTTGKVVSKFDPEVKKGPDQFTVVQLQLTHKESSRILPVLGVTGDAKAKIARRPGVKDDPEQLAKKIGLDRWYRLAVNEADMDVTALVQTLRADRGNVESAEANTIFQLAEEPIEPIEIGEPSGGESVPPPTRLGTSSADEAIPNDPYYQTSGAWGQSYLDQWGLQAIHAPQAWTTTKGSSEIVIAVVDDGLDYAHPDISAKVWLNRDEDINQNGCADYWSYTDTSEHTDCHGAIITSGGDINQRDDGGNGYWDDLNGMSFVDNQDGITNGPYGPIGFGDSHGTHVAGIIGATTNNNRGIASICQECTIMPIESWLANTPAGETTQVRGVLYALNNGADVINISWGSLIGTLSSSYISAMRDAIRYAHDLGVVMVAAVGNDSSEVADQYFPSSADHVIGVGAWDPEGRVRPFSNRGSTVDIVAPGGDILSLYSKWAPDDEPAIVNVDYAHWSGTSMATPFVAATVGLMLSVNPNLRVEDVTDILHQSAADVADPGFDVASGYGLLDADAAVKEAKRRIPDLEVSSFYNSRAWAVSSTQLEVDFTIENRSFFHAYNVPYRLLNETTGEVLFEGTAEDIFPGGYEWPRQRFNVPSLPTYVRFVVDPDGDIPETNENNNQAIVQVKPWGTPSLERINDQQVTPGQQLQFTVNATDPENQSLTYGAERLPLGSSFFSSSRQFSWTPGGDLIGRHRTKFMVTDPGGLSDEQLVTMTVTYPGITPIMSVIGDHQTKVGRSLTFSVSAQDPRGYPVFMGADALPPGAAFDQQTNTFSWTPTNEHVGAHNAKICADNGIGGRFCETFEIVVTDNQPPVFLNTVGDQMVDEDVTLGFQLNAWDPDGDELTYGYTVLSKPTGATFTPSLNPETGSFSWHPTYQNEGAYDIRFSASDGADSATQDVRIVVGDVNAPKYTTLLKNEKFPRGSAWARGFVDEGRYATASSYAGYFHPNGNDMDACEENTFFGGIKLNDRCVTEWSALSHGIAQSDIMFIRTRLDTGGRWDTAVENECVFGNCGIIASSSAGVYTFDAYASSGFTSGFTEQDRYGNNYGTAQFRGSQRSKQDWVYQCAVYSSGQDQGAAVFWGGNRIDLCFVDHSDGLAYPEWTIEIHRKSTNQAPIVSSVADQVVYEGQTLNLYIPASDFNEDRLFYSLDVPPAGVTIDQFTGQLRWAPGFDQAGDYTLNVRVSDSYASTVRPLRVRVENNNPPYLEPIGSKSVNVGYRLYFQLYATDPDNEGVTFTAANLPPDSTFQAGGYFEFRPAPTEEYAPTYFVTFCAVDSKGAKDCEDVAINVTTNSTGGGGGLPGGGTGEGNPCALPEPKRPLYCEGQEMF